MAQVLIWGKTREILAGALPPGVSAEEISSLAALQSRLDGKGGSLVLADTAHLDSERDALEAWLRGGGNRHAVIVAVVEAQEGDEALARFSFVDDILFKPVTPSRLQRRLDRSLDAIAKRLRVDQHHEVEL